MTTPAHNRHTIRLPGHDYTHPGAYFVTIVTQNRMNRFGKIQNEIMIINDAGNLIETCWLDLPKRFPEIELDEYIIMPNHFHGIICFTGEAVGPVRDNVDPSVVGAAPPALHQTQCGASVVAARPAHGASGVGTSPTPTRHPTLGDVVGTFKSLTTHQYMTGMNEYGWPSFERRFWQRNYYEHVIRNETELQKIRQYIRDNPMQWSLDEENPQKG